MPDYRLEARRAARRYGLDPRIFERQIGVESVGYDPDVISGRRSSPAGAQGIAQFMPGTARSVGVNPLNPIEALNGAAKLMAGYVKKYGGYEPALRAYNAGPGAIERSKGFKETNNYVAQILRGREPTLSAPSPSSKQSRPRSMSVPAGPATLTDSALAPADTSAVSMLQGLLERPAAVPQTSLAPSPLAPAAPMPQGYQAPQGQIPQQRQSALGDALSQIGVSELGATAETNSAPTTGGPDAEPDDPDPAPRGGGSSSGGAQAAVSFAQSRLGQYRESGGKNRGPQLDNLQKRFGFTGAAWCAMFTSVAVTRGGAPKSARTAGVAVVRQQAQTGNGGYQKGFFNNSPRPGDLILFGNDHIGMVERVKGNQIITIEGNTSEGTVSRRTRARGSGDIVRPKYRAR